MQKGNVNLDLMLL